MVWVTCGQFFVSFFLCSTEVIIQLLLGTHNFYHLKPNSLLIHCR